MSEKTTDKMKEVIKCKRKEIEKIAPIIKRICDLEFEIKEKTNTMLLETNWNEIINGRVTEAMKTAYIENILKNTINELEQEKARLKISKLKLELYNDYLSLYRNIVREETMEAIQ